MEEKNYRGFRDLIVYKKSYQLALSIFELTKKYPREEKYGLVDQIRRSSRSIPANIAESWAKRSYPKVFINKLTDALGEENETEVWLDMSLEHKYIDKNEHDSLLKEYEEVRKMLISMINKPESFCH